jgi:hypothetical protein
VDGSDTINALAALGLFLSAGAGALAGRVSSASLRKQVSQGLDDVSRTATQTERRTELLEVRARELRVRVVAITDEHEVWIVPTNAQPGSGD